MTRNSKRNLVALDRITDALIEDILSAPDAHLLAEAEADNDDGVAAARAAFERANRTVALRRMAGPKVAARGLQQPTTNIRALDPKTARDWLDEFMHGNPEAADKLVAVALGDKQLSDEDVYGMLEALQACGVLAQRGIEHGPR